jgi:hypothetical protein
MVGGGGEGGSGDFKDAAVDGQGTAHCSEIVVGGDDERSAIDGRSAAETVASGKLQGASAVQRERTTAAKRLTDGKSVGCGDNVESAIEGGSIHPMSAQAGDCCALNLKQSAQE